MRGRTTGGGLRHDRGVRSGGVKVSAQPTQSRPAIISPQAASAAVLNRVAAGFNTGGTTGSIVKRTFKLADEHHNVLNLWGLDLKYW